MTAPAGKFATLTSGKVHAGDAGRRVGTAVLYCGGRTVDFAVPTTEPVTCGACLKRLAKLARENGVELIGAAK